MSDEKDFPEDYREILVTLEESIAIRNKEGSSWTDKFLCVDIEEEDDYFWFYQPNFSRNNDVVYIRKENVRSILYMEDNDE